jgi:hypothetical protein
MYLVRAANPNPPTPWLGLGLGLGLEPWYVPGEGGELRDDAH